MYLAKKGGAPRKEARDAAVFLAHVWRVRVCGDTKTAANEWIVNAWRHHGITESSNVYQAIKRAKERGLREHLVHSAANGQVLIAIELREGDRSFGNGSRMWVWCDGMLNADVGRVKDLNVSVHQEVHHPSPVSLAVADLFKPPK